MEFKKSALSFHEQIVLLQSRGMKFDNIDKAKSYLSNISYYRLSAYWHTFLNDPKDKHIFSDDTTFELAIKTYVFDRKLRLLIFDEIERIEIALRTQIIYQCSCFHGSNWYENDTLFENLNYHADFIQEIKDSIDRTQEVFIEHYKKKYTSPRMPPAWMTLELASFGLLSKLYKNLKRKPHPCKDEIANHFGLSWNVLESWIESLSNVRNICAHHSRLWNKKLPKSPIFAVKPHNLWLAIRPETEKMNRIYISLAITGYLVESFLKNSSFKRNLLELLDAYPTIPKNYMGFPPNWKDDPFWIV
jgi:abortive infection bacteriophage resistance protein